MKKFFKKLVKGVVFSLAMIGFMSVANGVEANAAAVHVVKASGGAEIFQGRVSGNTFQLFNATSQKINRSELITVHYSTIGPDGKTYYYIGWDSASNTGHYVLESKCTGAMTGYTNYNRTYRVYLSEDTKLAYIPSETGTYRDSTDTKKGTALDVDGHIYNKDGRLYYQVRSTNKFVMAARVNVQDGSVIPTKSTLPSDIHVGNAPATQRQKVYFKVAGKYNFYNTALTTSGVKKTVSYKRGDLLTVNGWMRDAAGKYWFFTNNGYLPWDSSKMYDCNVISDLRCAVINYSRTFVGVLPYVYGGNSLTSGTDCSGFTQQVYKHFGYNIPRTAAEQRKAGIAVTGSPTYADLVCYSNANHVGLYNGKGGIVHSPTEGKKVEEKNSIDMGSYNKFECYRRIIY